MSRGSRCLPSLPIVPPPGISADASRALWLLGVVNIGAWIWAFAAFHGQPFLLTTGLLAYGFGLRHAVDADHIAAIDNVTRKLMQEGKRPVSVGLFFALGHSTVVVVVAAAVAATAAALEGRFAAWKSVGGFLSTGVSALFLFLIAAMNIVILQGVWRAFRHVRHGGALRGRGFRPPAEQTGLLARLFRPVFRCRPQLAHVPVGFLFGLGFDTATEVGLLGISATEAAKASRSGRSWCSPRCSPPACRWSTPRTGC